MSDESRFKLTIAGDPKTEVAVDRLVRQVHSRVLQVDEKVFFEYTHFAGLTFRLVWTGITRSMDQVDQVHKTALRQIEKNLNKWGYRIEIYFIEKEGD